MIRARRHPRSDRRLLIELSTEQARLLRRLLFRVLWDRSPGGNLARDLTCAIQRAGVKDFLGEEDCRALVRFEDDGRVSSYVEEVLP